MKPSGPGPSPGLGRGGDGKIRKRVPPALPDLVTVTVILNRETGRVEVEHEFCTLLEAENALRWALELKSGEVAKVNGIDCENE